MSDKMFEYQAKAYDLNNMTIGAWLKQLNIEGSLGWQVVATNFDDGMLEVLFMREILVY